MLIVMLREPALIAFLEASATGVSEIYSQFVTNRNGNLYNLSITPQVCYLEKALNDRFDTTDRRIYIDDGVFYDELYLFTDAESLDEYIYQESENKDLYIYTRSETGSESVDFIVNVPSSVRFNEAEMSAVIDMYKLASKTFKIRIKN
jgi:hypothetical protein